jgi:hypothetical protein
MLERATKITKRKATPEESAATRSMRQRSIASSPLIEPVDRDVDIALAPERRCIGHHRENNPERGFVAHGSEVLRTSQLRPCVPRTPGSGRA